VVPFVAYPSTATVLVHYRFETGPDGAAVTSILDSGPNSLNGTVGTRSPAITYTNAVPTGGGSFALNASGDGNYGQVANNSILRPTGDFTLELYARPDAPYGGSNLDLDFIAMMKSAEAGSGIISYGIGYQANTARFQTWIDISSGTGGEVTLTSSAVTTNAWHHVALVFDENGTSDVYSLYVDYLLAATQTGNFPIFYDTSLVNPFLIGAANFFGDPNSSFRRNFGGDIDEVRLSDQALTPSQFYPVPEPTPLALIAFGSLALLLRRQREGVRR
jgi:hypothetical protein